MDAAYTALKLGYPTSVTTHVAYNVVPVPRERHGSGQPPVKYNDSFPPADARPLHVPARGARSTRR